MNEAKAIEQLAANVVSAKRDPLDWARKIIRKHEGGERVPIYSLNLAREAFGITRERR